MNAKEDAEDTFLDLPEWMADQFDDILGCCRFLVSVVDPNPGKYEAGKSFYDLYMGDGVLLSM